MEDDEKLKRQEVGSPQKLMFRFWRYDTDLILMNLTKKPCLCALYELILFARTKNQEGAVVIRIDANDTTGFARGNCNLQI